MALSRFPRRNWVIVMLLRGLVYVSYTATVSSMHHYITTPSANQPAATNSTRNDVVPGFGGSEVLYTWAVVAYSIGELSSAMLTPILYRLLPYKLSLLIGTLTCPIGYLFYTLAPFAWFILIARIFIGMTCGILLCLIKIYLSETSIEVYQKERELKLRLTEGSSGVNEEEEGNPLKDRLFATYALLGSVSNIVLLAVSAVVNSIDNSLNPYRWPGWLVLITSCLCIVLHLLLFKDHKPFKMSSYRGQLFCCKKPLQVKKEQQSKSKPHIYVLLVVFSYSTSIGYALLDTLLNPILSDHFGFRVKDESFTVVAMSVILLVSSLLFMILKWFGLNTRKLFIIGMTMALIGALLMSDWQSIGYDACRQEFAGRYSNGTFAALNETRYSAGVLTEQYTNQTPLPVENTLCEQLSTDRYQCFWNPNSRVTGHYCPECFKVCRSVQKSLNFTQFSIGLALYTLTIPLLSVTIVVLITEVAPLPLQATLMSSTVIFNGLARMVSPSWMNPLYVINKNTFVPMAITAVHLAVVLVIFLAMYKKLAPLVHTEGSRETTDESEEEIELGPAGNGIENAEEPLLFLSVVEEPT